MKFLLIEINKFYYGPCSVEISKNTIVVSGKYGCLRKQFNSKLFMKLNFIIDEQKEMQNVFFIPNVFFRVFLKIIKEMIIGVTSRWFIELEMKGLGFKTFFSSQENLYKLDLGFNHYVFCNLASSLGVKTKKRSKYILVYGIDKLKVLNLVRNIISYRALTSYKFRGIKFKNFPLKLKMGKKKQFF